jgi:hypothetical protein
MTSSTLTRARTRIPSAVLVAVGLAAGFGIAQATGVRALGGAVFALGGLGAAWLWVAHRGWAVALGLGALYVGAFVLAHVLALGVGMASWLAVGLVTLAAAGVTYAVADRPGQANSPADHPVSRSRSGSVLGQAGGVTTRADPGPADRGPVAGRPGGSVLRSDHAGVRRPGVRRGVELGRGRGPQRLLRPSPWPS